MLNADECYVRFFLDEKIITIGESYFDFSGFNFLKEKILNPKEGECCKFEGVIYLSSKVCLKILSGKERFICILFNTPEFFDANLLHSKILKRFKKKYKFNDEDFIVIHPTRVALKQDKTKWNKVEFTYDPKQGDISLILEY
ncbi:hypothetical protein BJD20_06280 [Acinetobacter proteolyticus]|jgi:hypothetical protein|uniref:Uncharacterized protein n=1 Tax=Acinetobacter proteolyticus TaxID=1776741 RepID=A0A653K943_9GAMM|nr:hypothetical protein [Acinetobacter proteolyticus]OEY92943.1 hypothetical protein BJD20_06280 [Acinetobacter proteolyticus]VXA57267.1 conserved hypothetical protein [Acinetobacter proteolyticus]